jgi:CheY-like chemotaxis protein
VEVGSVYVETRTLSVKRSGRTLSQNSTTASGHSPGAEDRDKSRGRNVAEQSPRLLEFHFEARWTVGPLAARSEREHVGRPYSLLITDDDAAFRESLRGIFEPEGFRTLLAQSGEEALDILTSQQVHLALLDQNLPRLTGLETLRIIRQSNLLLPVILITADRTQQLLREALSAHAFCVMSKPVTRSAVVYTVQQALAKSLSGPGGSSRATSD